jgi:uncharacterized membrane protein YhhN
LQAARWVLFAAVLAGASYLAGERLPLPLALGVAWKGAGVGLLAVYAGLNARNRDGRLLAAVLAFGAAGDVLIETDGLVVGGAVFFAGHLTAIWLYLRNLRRPLAAAEIAFGLVLAAAIVALAWLAPSARADAPQAAAYAVGLAAMTATAWLCRFPRRLTALGAAMFAASDLLLFAKTGRPWAHELWAGIGSWGFYFGGQALIALGGVRGTAARTPHAEPLLA